MIKGSFIVKRFVNEHYTAVFNPNSGFFARIEDVGHDEPFWAEHGPELIDVAITNYCDRGCSFCYRNSDGFGSHISLENYEEILRQAQAMHVFQVALGGGNPNQHPHFREILRLTREGYGIIPNYTTNGRGLTAAVIEATTKYCGAVAVSAYPPYEETAEAIELLTSRGIVTNIHFVLTRESVETAISWLASPPAFLEKANAIIFLNYKPVGRLSGKDLLLKNSRRLDEFFKLAVDMKSPFRIGFDSCSITGIARFSGALEASIEGCDAGRFSLFVSEKMEVYPCSLMVETGSQGVSLKNSCLADIWRNHENFRRIRNIHAHNGCPDCEKSRLCLSGCPLLPKINLCPQRSL